MFSETATYKGLPLKTATRDDLLWALEDMRLEAQDMMKFTDLKAWAEHIKTKRSSQQ